jgi:hypothetical protein
MIDLERSLTELAEHLDVPSSDRFVSDVMRRISAVSEAPARRVKRRGPRLAGALAAVAVVATVVLPGPRHAVARWLGFDSVHIEPNVTVPTTTGPTATGPTTTGPTTTGQTSTQGPTSTTTAPIAAVLNLGPAVSIDQAMSQTGLPDPTPALLGDPQSVHVVTPPESGQIVLVYAPSDLVTQSPVTGVGALVSVMPAHIEEGFFQKTLGPGATVRPIEFNGQSGYWIEGSPHQLMFDMGNGQILPDTLRLATNTLLWERDGHVYRLEADISLETAERIAQSVA